MKWKFWQKEVVKPQERLVMVNVAGMGQGLTWDQVKDKLRGTEQSDMYRILMFLLLYQMGKSREHELDPAAEGMLRNYFSGKTAGAEEVLVWMRQIAAGEGDKVEGGLREWFGGGSVAAVCN